MYQNNKQLDDSGFTSLVNLSINTTRNCHTLIDKILELQTQLYQTHIENQQLRQSQESLMQQFQAKRNLLLEGKSQRSNTTRRISRNSSQEFIHLANVTPHPTRTPQPIYSPIMPITGQQKCFDSLKQTDLSLNSQQSMSSLSSPRATGIRKNSRVLPPPSPPSSTIPFRTIEQIWNNKGDSFLKKKGPSGHTRQKSYLN